MPIWKAEPVQVVVQELKDAGGPNIRLLFHRAEEIQQNLGADDEGNTADEMVDEPEMNDG